MAWKVVVKERHKERRNQVRMKIRANIAAAETSLVSVIVPTCRLDNLKWLRKAVDSVLGQTYSNLECIVIPDREIPEETRAYLDRAAHDDSRLRVLPPPNSAGQARARNAGISAARGEYIAMLDSDDVAEADRLEKQLAFLKATGSDLAGSCYWLIDGDGGLIGRKFVPLGPRGVRNWLFLFNPIANSTVLAKTGVLKRHPYPERSSDVSGVFGEDYALWVTLARQGYHLRNQPECLVKFRVHGSFIGKRRGWLQFKTDAATKLKAIPLYNPVLWPFVGLGALASAGTRLLPQRVVAGLYRARGRARFGA
ncbi:MAG: glycosyltransferase family 2 protein [Candidatus Hydrogenedentes bacterium]|nr:glycosyltransferase family 2 protein [Candidatus Hydrogenedentota bacterium]